MLARWRLAARLARREAARHPVRSALVVGLIALPVALLATGVTLWATTRQSPDEQATAVMGSADGIVGFDEAAGPDGWLEDLPDGARVAPVDRSWPIGVSVGDDRREVVFTGANLGDPLTDGLLRLVAGQAPTGLGQAAVSAPLLADLDAEIGDELALVDHGSTLEITGVVERPADLSASEVVVAPGTLPGQRERRVWLIDAGTAGEGAIPRARSGDPAIGGSHLQLLSTRSTISSAEPVALDMLAVLGGLALTEAAIVASAAFAVGVRRQLRALGLVAASGGRQRDLRRVVLASGLALGGLGAVLGAFLGVSASAVLEPLLEGWLDRRVGALVIPWGLVVLAMLGGMAASVAAAAVPARTAGQVPVTAALAGTRPVPRPKRRLLVLGGGLVGLGLMVITMAASNVRLRMTDTPVITFVTVGAIMVVLGFACASPSIAGLLGRFARRAPTLTRLALRDLARHRARTGPAISAVMAALALPIAVGMFLASTQARFAEGTLPVMAPEHVLVEAGDDSGAAADAAGSGAADASSSEAAPRPAPERVDAVANAVGASARVALTGLRPSDRSDRRDPANTSVQISATVNTTAGEGPGDHRRPLVAVDDVQSALDVWDVDEQQRAEAVEVLDEGGILLLGVEEVHASAGVLRVGGEVVDRRPLAGVRTPAYQDLPRAVTTEAIIDDLDVEPSAERVLLRAEDALDEEARTAAAEASGLASGPTPAASAGGGGDAARIRFAPPARLTMDTALKWIALGVSTAVAGGILVVALALSAAEGRAERAVIAAVGADRAMRRRFRAAQALALTLAAGVLALPAGLLPAVVTLSTREAHYPLRLPWEAMAAALIGVPLLAWAAARLLAREREARPADLLARTR